MEDIAAFLATCPVFQEILPEQIKEIAKLFRSVRYKAGDRILRQGAHNSTIFFICSGLLAARIQRGEERETVAFLKPPDTFGELSFVTGRPTVCDVEVDVDAEVVVLTRDAIAKLPKELESILRSLMGVIAGRLQDTVTRGAKMPEQPVILLRNHPNWEAPWSFSSELARLLARDTGRQTLLVNLGALKNQEIRKLSGPASVCYVVAKPGDPELRSRLAQQLTDWKRDFENIVVNLVGTDGAAAAEIAAQFANWHGDLLGPDDPVPEETGLTRFAVQSVVKPTLPVLSGNRRLIALGSEAESAFRTSGRFPSQFTDTVGSIARYIAGLQVGLALGGGAAWGWAHIGVLEVLEESGLPIDVISGCSMGSVIGALYAAGYTVEEMKEIAHYWKTRTVRLIDWRFWRMSLINDKRIRKAFRQYFGDRTVNTCRIPFWANAVDILTGKEFTIQSGTLVECVRASIALPGLISPFAHGPHLLVDAGIMNPVPAPLVRRMGCHFAIGINAMAALEQQKMNTRYPFNAFEVMARCMFVMGHEMGQARAEQAANIVFTPPLGDITLLQFSRSEEIIECGRNAAEGYLPGILASYDRLKTRFGTPKPEPVEQLRR